MRIWLIALLLAVLVGLTVGQASSQGPAYQVVAVDLMGGTRADLVPSIEKALNTQAAQGWRLVSVVGGSNSILLILQRGP